MRTDKYLVCIDVFSLENRGDWLMLASALEQVRKRMPGALVCVPRHVFDRDRFIYRGMGILPLASRDNRKDSRQKPIERMRALLGLRRRRIYPEEIDLVLLAAGFRFSDQFGPVPGKSIEHEVGFYRAFRKKGRRMVLLPQAFGPFETDCHARRIRAICGMSDLVYAREKTSYDHVVRALGGARSVCISPDFTCLYKGEPCELPFERGGYVVLVPNRQMITKTKFAANYCDFMIGVARMLVSLGEHVVFLNHESVPDDGLIDVFNASIDNVGVVVRNVSGGVCKTVLAGAKLVVTSRFHALVSALTEGVPALCTSWSHKYRELVAELGCPESCIDISDVESAIVKVKSALQTPAPYASPEGARSSLRDKVVQMWDEVFGPFMQKEGL